MQDAARAKKAGHGGGDFFVIRELRKTILSPFFRSPRPTVAPFASP
jgi:hypothetical protein